ncbi:hypothetical protein GDO86_007291 [Hymenochirus boettgeri]|uniref:WAP domain-containing protein n=1 Tax=Hymenochirus boettgeri TaxID=247094 RepID=A0A8T2IVZ4_9PIPI|nr:hypothetical protein GDO86_007291 [Hymenochirus boettgeri]
MKAAVCVYAVVLMELVSLTLADKPGICPEVTLLSLGICDDGCKTDSDCESNMKCCKTGCDGLQCQVPDEKPGLCPQPSNATICGNQVSCKSDSKCDKNLKCCPTGCGSFSCLSPIVSEEKPAT